MTNRFKQTSLPIAEDVDFDNTGNGFISDNVQGAIEEIGASASPGFSFGRNGNVSAGTWLNRPGNVPSNRAGVTISISNPVIVEISCSNRQIDTYTLEIHEHEGDLVNSQLLGTITVTNARGGAFSVNFPATTGRQIAVRLSNSGGGVRDIGTDVILIGSV